MKYDVVIGIDPDKEKSGFAFLTPRNKEMVVENLTFPVMLDRLQAIKRNIVSSGGKVLIVVEAGWMVKKSNFHDAQGHRAEKIAKDVGANHETGRKIIEMCKHYGLEVLPMHPLKKCWKGRDGKITDEEIKYFMPVYGRTNQDGRDAALLAWHVAGLPIKVKCL